MKAQNVTIDINKLTTEELKALVEMFFNMNQMDTVKQINDRIAFQEGWMSEKAEAEYAEKYCY